MNSPSSLGSVYHQIIKAQSKVHRVPQRPIVKADLSSVGVEQWAASLSYI